MSAQPRIQCVEAAQLATPAEDKEGWLLAHYTHNTTRVQRDGDRLRAVLESQQWQIRTQKQVPRTGLLLVGIGGNNGTTLAASLAAHRRQITWEDKHGCHSPDWLGSVAMMSTCKLGVDSEGCDIYVPIRSLLPMINPVDLVIGGWDISKVSLPEATRRAEVLPLEVQRQVANDLESVPVWPGAFSEGFIATNQQVRADHTLSGTKQEQLDRLRQDISSFKRDNQLDTVIVMWTGNTERFVEHEVGFDDTSENLLNAIKEGHSEVSPSLLYATAAILEGSTFINGSPQNTFSDGLIELAQQHKVYLIGDDLKTGQTKIKSVLADFMVSTALKPTSIVSYNHLGNNDGLNLSSERQFRSKEVTKASVVDDMIQSNSLLYPDETEKPDHLVVIKYVPAVGDSKRALDEYTARIFMGGSQTIVLHNTCEDSLLAVPIIIDLIVFAELFGRIQVKPPGAQDFSKFDTMLSLLSLFLKAPQVPRKAPVVNALFAQREALFTFLRAACGLPPQDYLALNHRI
eukprot:Protomagalhaensia_wolfi_Nauph_80__2042@NODE_22_length_4814_cov_65_182199_g17_i0_p1_GENE_NODE_22_length_4814_cov_65_182199_g17_i0NODE_22_length_4814_cov_65_182199_g17_i0_p1_ORF_typecomplete_len516_score89_42NAD_binding_5/PF07994_12/1_9e154Inos1P_synth/PF01658_17/3_1e51_NODE_22_length_4814_cov_65_182199_g17_i0611608